MEREQKLREKLRETEKKDEHDNQVVSLNILLL